MQDGAEVKLHLTSDFDVVGFASHQADEFQIAVPRADRPELLIVDTRSYIPRLGQEPVAVRGLRVRAPTELANIGLEVFTDPEGGWDLSAATEELNLFVAGFAEVRVVGNTEQERRSNLTESKGDSISFGASLGASPHVEAKLGSEATSRSEHSGRTMVAGVEETWIDFGFFSRAIQSLAAFVRPRRLWLLLDEWTTIPTDIQPFLADLLRRSMFSVANVTVKIAAIEHRASFKLDRRDESYIGFELGADIGATINLDDYLVIDNDEARARDFFRHFIVKHTMAVAREIGIEAEGMGRLVSDAFTQENVFTEFVRASEGVPRDAMHILAVAAQRASAAQITMPIIRSAAYNFFQSEKYTAIQSNKENRELLDWIRDEVISGRRTRAFLLPVGTQDPIIDRLFDRRALHILNRSRSAAHRPGERFIVYKLDYGLYVDLINTEKYPTGLLLNAEVGDDIDFDVPLDDARSYRRAILDLDRFYARRAAARRQR